MLRSVTLLLCVAVSSSLWLQKDRWADDSVSLAREQSKTDSEDSLANLAKDFSGGLTYPGLTDLMELDSNELLDVNKPKKIDITYLAKKEKVIKAGDGVTYPKTGDTVWVRMKGVTAVKHYHEIKFDNFMEYVYPAPVIPGIGGQKNPMPKDEVFLPQMTAGEIALFKMTAQGDSKQIEELTGGDSLSDGLTFEVELRSVNPNAEQPEPEEHQQKSLDEAQVLKKVLKKQKMGLATMSRTVVKEGDGVTHVQPGDNVTVRVYGVAKRSTKGRTVKYSQIQTFQYPQLTSSYSVQGFKVKDSWDEHTLPDMTQGQKMKIAFDPMQFCAQVGFAHVCGPRFHFDEMEVELLKVN